MGHGLDNTIPVSYTHLDVYKRQLLKQLIVGQYYELSGMDPFDIAY